jgi:hypothetical protein
MSKRATRTPVTAGRPVVVLHDGATWGRFRSVEAAVMALTDETGISHDSVWEQTRDGVLVDGRGDEWWIEVQS